MERNNTSFTPEMLVQLQRDDLRCLLKKELAKDSADMDDVFVRLLLSELEIRGKDPSFEDDAEVVAACEKFYCDTEKNRKKKGFWYHGWMLKTASVVLVLGILLFALPGAAQANNVRDVLSWWSNSVFQLFSPGERPPVQEYVYETDHPGLQQIYDTVTELGVTDPVVPRWVPDGLKLVELKVFQMPEDSSVHACLNGKENSIIISITSYSEQNALQHEKNAENVHIWDLAGKEHYILSNNDELIVTWIGTEYECTVITDCVQEDVYKMIKSIYASEG